MAVKSIKVYLFFGGRCEEAVGFYQRALGAEVTMMMRYREGPQGGMHLPAGWAEKVMHVEMKLGSALLMASDGSGPEEANPVTHQGAGVSLEMPTAGEVDEVLGRLSEGGEMLMPGQKTFWAERFGMARDRFGVLWMVGVEGY
jgi:PhnB protein